MAVQIFGRVVGRWVLLLPLTVLMCGLGAPPAGAEPAVARDRPAESRIESVTLDPASGQRLDSPASHPYRRVVGTVRGVVAATEDVRGLTGPVAYSAQFEMFVPLDRPSTLLLTEVENRGNPISPGTFDDLVQVPPTGPPATANWSAYTTEPYGGAGFFLDGRRSWARVQWQAGFATGVPQDAQGVGLVIVRDFGRMLAGRFGDGPLRRLGVGAYRDRILFGGSQSAWFVDTFLAEGFNVDPARAGQGVYQVAMTLDGGGNWAALNNLAGDAPQGPYVLPDGVPLRPSQILSRPASDPFLVDYVAYTDFYRLRVGLTGREEIPVGMRRYDWPAAHAPSQLIPSQLVDSFVFGAGGAHCNNGTPIPLSPLDSRPYSRALLVGVENELVARRSEAQPVRGVRLPPSTTFALGPIPDSALTYQGQQTFNPLPGITVPVPRSDRDGWPVGGVRFPEVDLPLGRPIPPAIPHVGTSSIADICGNFGGYAPFTAAELATRYGSRDAYLDAYGHALDRLIAQRYLLTSDRQQQLDEAARRYDAAP
ncbi:MAG: hypothetical protein J0I34_25975 [Pseudonocardia sp.]|uniref:alpha/beta hydrolase domain-containing protein n=1 Tax=unclassified Pseudonocardia TaxID=2619320 RepID=UPI00086C02BB|nr:MULTISPECIES: alpha/beta hydrolase domain-containing protein [unclassified Pseudonocardia]MBN9112222.1 hypothetical protein [Pseudonocardia sp.]ODU30158.1 MAG: hypothetical protein ABS80_00710 [Pseudonocardia sp. SCN 72-51]ODV03083.1 MAG: hypothetical protein ABT15_23940 [Pseudonocardia sp. SCN 73-27]